MEYLVGFLLIWTYFCVPLQGVESRRRKYFGKYLSTLNNGKKHVFYSISCLN